MATSFNDLTQIMTLSPTFRPQSLTADGNGLGVDCADAGTALINANFQVGDVTGFTSLAMYMQASTDDSTYTNISGASFTTVTAANSNETISFQLPTAASATTAPYRYVRAVADITGTSARIAVNIIFDKRMPSPTSGYVAAPQTVN